MNLSLEREKKILLVLSLMIFSGLIFFRWMNFEHFSTGDSGFVYPEFLRESVHMTIWVSSGGMGGQSIAVWNHVVSLLDGLFGFFGTTLSVSEKFTTYWPTVFLLPLGIFLLLNRALKNGVAAFVGAVPVPIGSYYLSIATHGHMFLTVAATWMFFSLYFFIRMLEERKAVFSIISALFFVFSGVYDFRVVYIFVFVFFLYLLFYFFFVSNEALRSDRIRVVLPLLGLMGLIVLFLNIFWLLPTFSVSGNEMSITLNRDLFGNQYFELDDAMYLSHPFWTGYGVAWMSDQPTPWWLSILGVLAWIGFWVGRKNRTVVFFALLSVFGILVSKQVAEPWGNLYYYLYDHLPGFNAFREASKFYVLIALGYSVGIGALVDWLLPTESVGKEK